jgi:hypothetical protein
MAKYHELIIAYLNQDYLLSPPLFGHWFSTWHIAVDTKEGITYERHAHDEETQ